jgi:hypothetical protein
MQKIIKLPQNYKAYNKLKSIFFKIILMQLRIFFATKTMNV